MISTECKSTIRMFIIIVVIDTREGEMGRDNVETYKYGYIKVTKNMSCKASL